MNEAAAAAAAAMFGGLKSNLEGFKSITCAVNCTRITWLDIYYDNSCAAVARMPLWKS